MKKILFYKKLFQVFIGLQICLVLLCLAGFSHYYYQLYSFKSSLKNQIVYEMSDDIQNKSLNEVLKDPILRNQLDLIIENSIETKPITNENLYKQLNDIEYWLFLYAGVAFIGIILNILFYFYIRHKWKKQIEFYIIDIIERMMPIAEKYSEGKEWLYDLVYLILDINGLEKYSFLVKEAVRNYKIHQRAKSEDPANVI